VLSSQCLVLAGLVFWQSLDLGRLFHALLESLQQVDDLTGWCRRDLDRWIAVELGFDNVQERGLVTVGERGGIKPGGFVFDQLPSQGQLVCVELRLVELFKIGGWLCRWFN
jgi:hypothetical protein